MQLSFLIIDLIWLHVNLSRPGADKLLHFLIASISLILENEFHSDVGLSGISSRKWVFTSLSWAELNDLWRTFQRFSSSVHRCPSYWMASTAGSLYFLTQFMSSHGPHFLFAILFIFSLKKEYLDSLTVLLKSFQFSRLWDYWYLYSIWQQSLFHHTLKCLVILTVFKCLNQMFSILVAKSWTTSSKDSASWINEVFKFLVNWMRSSINRFSSSLPLTNDCCLVGIYSSLMGILTVIGA